MTSTGFANRGKTQSVGEWGFLINIRKSILYSDPFEKYNQKREERKANGL